MCSDKKLEQVFKQCFFRGLVTLLSTFKQQQKQQQQRPFQVSALYFMYQQTSAMFQLCSRREREFRPAVCSQV